MKVVALVSGGKDSCYNMMQCVAEGHEIVALANLRPVEKDELDSYMYQTVGHHAIELYADAMGLPLYRQDITGISISQDKDYKPSEGDEVEDLYRLLSRVKENVHIEGVSVGAILSNYQRVRVENVCARLGLTSLGYLWRRDQEELLDEMINAKIEAIVIKVAALGLDSTHLCKTLAEIQPHMIAMKEKYQLNPCGEGGEYETFTLDCPLFNKKIVIDEYEVVKHDSDPFAPVCFVNFKKMHLEDKAMDTSLPLRDRLEGLAIKRGSSLLEELGNPQDHQSCLPTPNSQKNNIPQLLPENKSCQIPEGHMKSGAAGFSWVSGITATRGHGSLSETIRNAFDSLKDILTSNDLSVSSVVMVYLHSQDLSEFSAINGVMVTLFPNNPPVRVTVEVNHDKGVIFSMDCLLYQAPGNETSPLAYDIMHVQGVSHWAPANIGPYSQSIRVGNLVYCAGMIGLCPSTMAPIEGGVHAECVLCMRSISRVLQAMHRALHLKDIVFAICYMTDSAFISVAKEDFSKAALDTELAMDVETERGFPPVVCYVVVPRLPRDVSVEWHVIASLSKNKNQYKEWRTGGESVHIDVKYCWDQVSAQGIGLVNLGAEVIAQCLRLDSVLKDAVSQVEMILEHSSCLWKDVLCLRLFYCHSSSVDCNTVSAALRSILPCSNEDLPALSCVPVVAVETSYFMSICVYLCGHQSSDPDT